MLHSFFFFFSFWWLPDWVVSCKWWHLHVKKLQIWRWSRSHPLSARSHQLPVFTFMGGSIFTLCKHRLCLHPLHYCWRFRLLKLQGLGEDPVVKGCYKWPSPPGTGVPPAWPLEPSLVCPDRWGSLSQVNGFGCCFPVCMFNQQQSWMCIPETQIHKGHWHGRLHRLT